MKRNIIIFLQIFLWLKATNLQAQVDCNNDLNGNASLDLCGLCTGGLTNRKPCEVIQEVTYYIKNINSAMCLKDATGVNQSTCTSLENQQWKLIKQDNFYKIQNLATKKYLTWEAESTSFVLSTFKGDNNAGMKLSIYTSPDALQFKLLSDTGFEGSSSNLRDPSIMRHTDGKYYVAYTNAPTESCCDPEDHFSIASSTDLIRWTDLVQVPAGIQGARHTWAPEWYIEGNDVYLIVSIETGDWQFKAYRFKALNNQLNAWSKPVAIGIGPNYIDTYLLKVNETYHAFTKNETSKYLEHATSTSMTGPWKFIATGNWSGWGAGIEGVNLVKLANGSYRAFFDSQGFPFMYADSQDLLTWTTAKNVPGIYNQARHGTVINLANSSPKPSTTLTSSNTEQALWRIEKSTNGYTLVPALNPSLAADVTNESLSDGAGLIIYPRSGKANQQFDLVKTLLSGIEDPESLEIYSGILVWNDPGTPGIRVNAARETAYQVVNSLGVLVEQGTGNHLFQVGVSLPAGFYVVTLSNGQEMKTLKIVAE